MWTNISVSVAIRAMLRGHHYEGKVKKPHNAQTTSIPQR